MTEEKTKKVVETEVPPVIEDLEPKTVEPVNEEELLKRKLEEMGVTSASQLDDMKLSASQAGRLGNMMGDLRRQNEELKALLESQGKPEGQENYYQDTGQSHIDIEKVVEKAVTNTVYNLQKKQREAQEAVTLAMGKVLNNDRYKKNQVLKNVFDEHIQNPAVISRINSGETTPIEEFNNIALTYYEKVQSHTAESVKMLTKEKDSEKVPHIESNQAAVTTPKEPDERAERIRKITENTSGSDRDIEALLKEFLPSGDPILRGS